MSENTYSNARLAAMQIAARGVRSAAVLKALGKVRRELYETASVPYVVALMVEALELKVTDRVLEIGTGSGYTSAVLAEIAAAVFTIEREEELTVAAATRLARDGYSNVRVRQGDGALGWPQNAPFDAIVVAEGGPAMPQALREQLAVGGRLVIPVREQPATQKLIRVTRISDEQYRVEELSDVCREPADGQRVWLETAVATRMPAEHRASRR